MLNIILQTQSFLDQMIGLAPMFAILLVVYFFFIRPQSKKQREQVDFLGELQKGDEVVTASGIIGRINKIEENVIQLQLDQKSFVRVLKTAINKEMTASLNATEEEK